MREIALPLLGLDVALAPKCKTAVPPADDEKVRPLLERLVERPDERDELVPAVMLHASLALFAKVVAKLSSGMFMRKNQRRATVGVLTSAASRSSSESSTVSKK